MAERIAAFLLALAVWQGGQAQPHTLPELGVQLDLPAGMLVLARNTPADDPAFAALGLDAQQWGQHMEEHNLYLCAVSPDPFYEFTLTATEAVLPAGAQAGFAAAGEDVLARLGGLLAAAAPAGLQVAAAPVYTGDGAACMVLDFAPATPGAVPSGAPQPGERGAPLYGRQYLAVRNGRVLALSLCSTAPPDARQLAQLADVAASAGFPLAGAPPGPGRALLAALLLAAPPVALLALWGARVRRSNRTVRLQAQAQAAAARQAVRSRPRPPL